MNHLDLSSQKAYKSWVYSKRTAYDRRLRGDFESITRLYGSQRFSIDSLSIIHAHVASYNFALYSVQDPISDHLALLKDLGQQLGLKDLDQNLCANEDRITRLTDEGPKAGHYIPYTNKAIGWHTDGYYNPLHQRVLSFILHCEQSAAEGGESRLLDPDMVYIHLRDHNPRYISALSSPRVMCIPENRQHGELLREQTCTAVFMQEGAGDGQAALAMRYSGRKHNIIWADDGLTTEALACLTEFIDSSSPYHVRYRLKPGEGVICNNVLHARSAFSDNAHNNRVYYRARYYNRIPEAI